MASGMGWELTEENKKQFLIPEGGMAWNDSEIGIQWSKLVGGEYKGTPAAEGYTLDDGTPLNLSEKDQKWLGLKDTFKF